MTAKRPQFRLFDFQVVNEDYDNYDDFRQKKILNKDVWNEYKRQDLLYLR